MNTTTTISINPQWLALVVGSVIPLIVGLISKSAAPIRTKAIVNGLLSALAGAGTTALTTGGRVEWQSWVIGILSTWIASIATYYGFWKPAGVEPAINKATGQFGIGRRKPPMNRTVGLRGRLPVLPPHERLPLAYAHEYLAAPLPNPNYPIDVTESITDFGMMGNDEYGDCGAAGEMHIEMTTAKAAGTKEPDPHSPLAVNRYCDYVGTRTPPGPGVVLAKYLLWLYQRGDIKAFAPVDHTNKAQCDALMQLGHGLYVGVCLTDRDEQDFQNGVTWGADGVAPVADPNSGHCIVKAMADGKGLDGYVTWGSVQMATEQWTEACTQEAWLVVTTEEQLAAFTPALLRDVQALAGTGGTDVVAPEPTPPNPLSEFVAELENALNTFREDVTRLLGKL